jgi:hypothetical protein
LRAGKRAVKCHGGEFDDPPAQANNLRLEREAGRAGTTGGTAAGTIGAADAHKLNP